MIRTFVGARTALARAGLAAVVRGDARLALAGEADLRDLAGALVAADPDVLLESRDAEHPSERSFALPTVALVDDPRDQWARDVGEDEPSAFALLGSDASPEEIVAAVVAVAAGLVAVQPRTLARDDRRAFARGTPSAASVRAPIERLTAREADVLGELARGVPNKTIAVRLGISEHTVKFHVAAIFAKLGAASRTEAVAQGVRLGLIML